MAKIDLAAYLDIPDVYESCPCRVAGQTSSPPPRLKPHGAGQAQEVQVLGDYGVAYEKEAY